MTKFSDLGLSESTLAAITKKGFEEPSAIQALTIPAMLTTRKDLIAQAQTGTGKTAAFGLPLLDTIDSSSNTVQAIILAPTRELVIQIVEEMMSFNGDKAISIAPIYGGQSIDVQLRRLRRGVHIVVGTPGRMIDHLRRKTLNLSNITDFVMDEADEMLNMGFIDDIETILEQTNESKRVLLFSATMPQRIKDLAKRYLTTPEHLKTKANLTTDLTDQIYFEVHQRDKFEALTRIIDIEREFYAVIFCRTKNDVDQVANDLGNRGYLAEALHGDISQGQREKTLRKFRKKVINILVATDVAARGIDVTDITHVINYSLPQNSEAYVHRIGRTGRAGKEGTAITFVTPSEFRKLGFIKRGAKSDMRKEEVPSVEKIISEQRRQIKEELGEITEAETNQNFVAWASELLEEAENPAELVAALLESTYGKRLDVSSYRQISPVRGGGGRNDRGGRDNYRDRNDRGGRNDRGDRGGRDNYRDRNDRGSRDRNDRGGREERGGYRSGSEAGREGFRRERSAAGGGDGQRPRVERPGRSERAATRDSFRENDRGDARERRPRNDHDGGETADRKPRTDYVAQEGTTRLFIAKGKNDDFNKKKIQRMMSRAANVDKDRITNVSIYDTYAFVTAPFDVAESILRSFQKEERGRKPMVSKAKL